MKKPTASPETSGEAIDPRTALILGVRVPPYPKSGAGGVGIATFTANEAEGIPESLSNFPVASLNVTTSLMIDELAPVALVATRLLSVVMLPARLLSPDAGSGQPSTNGGAEMFGFGEGHAPNAAVVIASRIRAPEIKPCIYTVAAKG
jgi:hypothetical protein